jgi:hypothetical protein
MNLEKRARNMKARKVKVSKRYQVMKPGVRHRVECKERQVKKGVGEGE